MLQETSLNGNHLFGAMQAADYERLRPLMIEAPLARDQVLNEVGSQVDTVYFPAGAVLSIVTTMLEGHSVEACTVGRESGYGLLNTLGSTFAIDRVFVQVPGPSFKIATSQLKRVASESPALTELIVRHIQASVTQTEQSVACNAVHPLEARLCRWLLMTQDRSGNGKLPLTQEFLSFMLGVQRTSVTIAARSLQSAGFIIYHRGRIEVLDRAGLEEGSCECYATVKEKQAQLFQGHPRLR